MVKVNCRNKHSDQCPVCIIELDNQQQVFKCTKLLQECDMIVDDEILHSHIFDKNVKKQALAVKLFKQRILEKLLLKLTESEEI